MGAQPAVAVSGNAPRLPTKQSAPRSALADRSVSKKQKHVTVHDNAGPAIIAIDVEDGEPVHTATGTTYYARSNSVPRTTGPVDAGPASSQDPHASSAAARPGGPP
eukprot:6418334-Amphidinium_carterae.1